MNNETHILPRGDIREHREAGTNCACRPTIERYGDAILVIHNAFDARELIEEVRNQLN
jgi:hypothetical protein